MQAIYKPQGRAGEYAHLAVNLFTGCGHGCQYCYCPRVLHIKPEVFFAAPEIRAGILAALAKQAPTFAGTEERALLCFTCDAYQPLNRLENITRPALQILRDNDISFTVLTKGGTWAVPDFDLYGDNDAFGTTLTLLDNNRSMEWEPFAALPGNRIRAIELAKQKGITTWVSLEPIIDPSASLEIIKLTHAVVDHYMIGKMNYQRADLTPESYLRFGRSAIELCERFGKTYYIKQDLAKCFTSIPFTQALVEDFAGIAFHNTDIRRVKR